MSYEQSASVYDAIYTAMKDYRRETERLHAIIMQRLLSFDNKSTRFQVPSLLDVACGTGLHLVHLRDLYRVEGLDLSPAQLAIARTRLGPDIPLHLDDMVSFSLKRQYSVITCLFSAIGHLKPEQLAPALANMAGHLLPGGLLMVEPWLMPHMWRPGHISMDVVNTPELKVARIGRATRDGNVTHLELEHLVARAGGNEHFVEHHEVMMFTEEEFLVAYEAAGLNVRYEAGGISNNGRGLFVGRKPF